MTDRLLKAPASRFYRQLRRIRYIGGSYRRQKGPLYRQPEVGYRVGV